jgi:hypothetical protein
MAKKTRQNIISLALTDEEYEEVKARSDELEKSIQQYLRDEIWGNQDHQALLKCLIKLERTMNGLRQDFRMVYFPDG